MAENDTASSGGAMLSVSGPILAGGLYTIFNHGTMHSAVHSNIQPEAFAGFVAWMLWGLEIVTGLSIAILFVVGFLLLFAGSLMAADRVTN